MKLRYTLIFSFFSIGILNAQLDTFDIGNFILPEVSLKRLNFSGELNGSNQSYSTLVNTGINSSVYLNINFNYSNFESDRNQQRMGSGYLSNALNYRNNAFDNNGNAISNALFNRTNLTATRVIRNYIDYDHWFYGINWELDIRNTLNSGENNGNIRFFENTNISSLRVPLTFGFGRIEPVTDAWHAVRILTELDKLRCLIQPPTSEQIYDLAEKLSDLNYHRIFDSRLGRIRRMTALDKHLYDNKLVDERSSAYFTALYDMYEFGIQTDRYSGERISYGIMPEISITRKNDDNFINTTNYSFLGFVDYTFNYPVNQFIQLDINANLEGGYTISEPSQQFWQVIPYLEIELGYYPTTRTFFSAKASTSGLYRIQQLLANSFSFYTRIEGNFHYFISPKTAIAFKLGYLYSQKGSNNITFSPFDIDGHSFNYSINLLHALY